MKLDLSSQSPLYVLPKQKSVSNEISIWIGAFGALNQDATWRVIQQSNNKIVQEGQITKHAWRIEQPVPNFPAASIHYRQVLLPSEQLLPNEIYRVETRYGAVGLSSTASFRTLPTSIPIGKENALNIVLASCYERTFDDGRVAHAFTQLFPAGQPPHMKLFTGDQVYNDHPFNEFLWTADTPPVIAARIHQNYNATWHNLRPMHANGFNHFIADDHEIYNGYPQPPAFMVGQHLGRITNTHLSTWADIAKRYFNVLQSDTILNTFQIGNDLSFCIVDTRIVRDRQGKNFISNTDFAKLTKWLSELNCPGVLVLSQPLLVKKSDGNAINQETNTAAYRQYDALVSALAQSNQDIVLLSGDVHFSRFARMEFPNGHTVYEVISSPMSLIELTRKPGDLLDLSEQGATNSWSLSQDTEPKQFPPSFVERYSGSRATVEYLQAGKVKRNENGKKIKNRSEENFASIRFFKPAADKAIEMNVTTHLPRIKGSTSDQEDWSYQVTLGSSN